MASIDDKSIFTDTGEEIKWMPKDLDLFLDKTTLLFGGSFTGKTTIIEEILYLVKDHIPNYIVVASENSKKAYQNKLPPRCIKKDLSKKKIQQIWDRQFYTTQLYNTANDINVLESLFNKMPDRESIVMLNAINKRAAECVKTIESSTNLNFAQKKSQKTAIEELQLKRVKELYKVTIRRNQAYLATQRLTPHEKIALEYLDLNPRLMIIIDDCTDKFEMWMKYFKNTEVNPFNSIFYQGRHNYITFVFAAHNDKPVKSELRQNSRVTIFTDTKSAQTSFVTRTSNGWTKDEQKEAVKFISRIFKTEANGVKNHQKMCYIREDPYPFRYTIANLYPDFTLGCTAMYDLTNKMPKKDDSLVTNPYIKELLKKKRD
jgi:transcription-repair coupling factor (superfamily II helicase)